MTVHNEQATARADGRCPAPEDRVAYATGNLPSAEAEAVEAHVAACVGCRASVEEARDTVSRMKAAVADEDRGRDLVAALRDRLPDSAWEDAMAGGEGRGDARVIGFPRVLSRVAAAVTVALGLGWAVWTGTRQHAAPKASVAGGSTEMVRRGLAWLESHREPSGGWNVTALGGSEDYEAGLNGLAIMAFTRHPEVARRY